MSTKQTRISLDQLIRRTDPDFDADRKKQLEYQFTERDFYADPTRRGAYAPE